MSLLENLRKNPFVLAPMAGITDLAFRSFMREMGASIVITELVSATGLEYSSAKTKSLMAFSPDQHPVGIQLFGEDPQVVARAAQYAQDMGCDFVDLNFGCPVPKVVKKGAGSAILKDLDALKMMLQTVRSALRIPLTIKIRTGWDFQSRNSHEVCHIAKEEGILWVSIHGRTRSQGYDGQADWDYIADVKSKAGLPIIGNGDILTADHAVRRLKTTGVDGVMIGRGALKNPAIFLESLRVLNGNQVSEAKQIDLAPLFARLATILEGACEGQILQIQLRKFAAWFSTGYPGSAAFRKAIFQSGSPSQTMEMAMTYFHSLSLAQPEDTSSEPFLMGGHG